MLDNSVLNGDTTAFISTVHSPPTEFQGYVNAGTAMSSYIVILALLLRLRQACDHPFLALGREAHEAPVEEDTDAIGAAHSDAIVAVPGGSSAVGNSAAAASSSGSSSDKITPSYVQQLYARFAAMAGHSSAAVMTPSKAVRSSGNSNGASNSGVSSSSKKRKASGGQQQQQQQQQGSIAFVHKVVGELQAKGGLAASVSTVLIAPLHCV
jgi:hypothetical protein